MARILVAEDEQSVREFMLRALRQAGHDVTAVRDGQAAVRALAVATFDLLVADIVMPGLDGIGLALKVAKDHSSTAVLLATGFPAEAERAFGLEDMIHGVLRKPFALKDLTDAVDAALAARRKT